MDSIGPRDVGSLADEIEKMRSREEKRFAAELLEAPFFKKIIAVLEQFQSLVQAEPDEEKKGDMLKRFQSLFMLDGILRINSTALRDELLTIEDVTIAAANQHFVPSDFAQSLAATIPTEYIGMKVDNIIKKYSEPLGFDDLDVMFVQDIGGIPGELHLGLHLNISNISDMEVPAAVKRDIDAIKETVRNDEELMGSVIHMTSWLLTPRHERLVRRILGPELTDQIHYHNPPSEEYIVYGNIVDRTTDKRSFLPTLSYAVTFNSAFSRDWIVDATLPQIGEIEIPARDFVST